MAGNWPPPPRAFVLRPGTAVAPGTSEALSSSRAGTGTPGRRTAAPPACRLRTQRPSPDRADVDSAVSADPVRRPAHPKLRPLVGRSDGEGARPRTPAGATRWDRSPVELGKGAPARRDRDRPLRHRMIT